MAERFANESKNIVFESGSIPSLGVFFLLFGGVLLMAAKTATKAENHSKEGPINTTVLVNQGIGQKKVHERYLYCCSGLSNVLGAKRLKIV